MPSKFATGYVVKGNDNNIYHVFGTKQGIFKWDVNENRDIKISEDNPLEINIIDNWIYYHHNSQIKKIKVDGTSTNILFQAAGIGSSLHAVGDWIYYNFTNNNTRSICKMKLDGTQNTKIIDNLKVGQYEFFINNVWIYFIDDGSFIYKANLDGTNVEKICEDMASFFKVSDDYIFYCNNNVSESSVCRLDLDGNNKLKLADSKNKGGCNSINVVGGWVYYTINSPYDFLYYRVKIDGSNDSLFPLDQRSDWPMGRQVLFSEDQMQPSEYLFKLGMQKSDVLRILKEKNIKIIFEDELGNAGSILLGEIIQAIFDKDQKLTELFIKSNVETIKGLKLGNRIGKVYELYGKEIKSRSPLDNTELLYIYSSNIFDIVINKDNVVVGMGIKKLE